MKAIWNSRDRRWPAWALIGSLAFSAGAVGRAETTTSPQPVDLGHLIDATVVIRSVANVADSIEAGGVVHEYRLGTGVYVHEDGRILTAFHNIEPGGARPQIDVMGSADESFSGAYVVDYSRELDLALVRDARERAPVALTFKNTDVAPGERVFALGIPREMSERRRHVVAVSWGALLSPRADVAGSDSITSRANVTLVDCTVWNGFSGGLMASESLEPLGLILGAINSSEGNRCYARPGGDVRRFLEENGIF